MTGPNVHIRTFTHKELNLFQLGLEDIHIKDIAHSLACMNRFNGHVKKPISVAQHSVYVSRLCAGTPYECQALFHDAAEAYIGDVTKWLKRTPQMAAFVEMEDQIQELIFRKFNCPVIRGDVVTMADRIMVRYEGIKGFKKDFKIHHEDFPDLTAEEIERVGTWAPWSWQAAERGFLDHARMLGFEI